VLVDPARRAGARQEDVVIIVTGSVRARPDALDEVLRLSPGCMLHSAHQDVEDPNRVVFVEHWADRDALEAHFRVTASRTFVLAAGALATDPPTLEIYEASRITV
jgi:quinol monooxygenase YgiN